MAFFERAGRLTACANPPLMATLLASTGSSVNADGSQTPRYTATQLEVEVEVQALGAQDLRQLGGLSQQADMRAVYARGVVRALDRPLQCGGDILQFYGSDWLVTQSLQEWGGGGWVKVLVTRPMPPAPFTPL